MTPFGGAIVRDGGLVNARVCLPCGGYREGPAIIDTGADLNLVSSAIVPPGLTPIHTSRLLGLGGGDATLHAYDVFLMFPDCVPPIAMPVRHGTASAPSNYLYSSSDIRPPIVALIGREMLSNFVMVWDGPNGLFVLYPSATRQIAR